MGLFYPFLFKSVTRLWRVLFLFFSDFGKFTRIAAGIKFFSGRVGPGASFEARWGKGFLHDGRAP